MKQFPTLTSPIFIGNRNIKNRVVVPPMADFGMTAADGLPNQRHYQHYEALAEGGAGMIIIEACAVSKMKEPRNTIGLYDDAFIPHLRILAQAAKTNQSTVLVQLLNTGLSAMDKDNIIQIEKEQFLQYKLDFVNAAIRCKKAGFDGVELHAAHGFYLNQILETSTRTDGYGGDFMSRFRIIRELICEIKETCGHDFLVSVRFGNSNISELLETARSIEKAGGDLLDISSGCNDYQDVPENFPYNKKIYAASTVKEVVNIPVICVGDITTGEQAETILDRGYADMTAIGRGHLCDPAWFKKATSDKIINKCLKCRYCMWYIDGRKCPALK